MPKTDSLLKQLESIKHQYQRKLPPVLDWNPPLSGEIDILIQADGQWRHEGDLMTRQSLVNLFSSILKKEDDDYFLVTPVEKWKIKVEIAPFLIINFEREDIGKPGLERYVFTTQYGDQFMLDKDHPLWFESNSKNESGAPVPLVMVRDGMPGLVHRNVYYQLAEITLSDNEEDPKIISCGESFKLQ